MADHTGQDRDRGQDKDQSVPKTPSRPEKAGGMPRRTACIAIRGRGFDPCSALIAKMSPVRHTRFLGKNPAKLFLLLF
jgi:hypothetical protein